MARNRTRRHWASQRGHQARRCLQDMLAVVQHHQQLTAGQRAHQPGGRVGASRSDTPSACATLAGTSAGSVSGGQLDQPGAVAKPGLGERRHPQRQPGLAAPARAGQRDHPGRAEAFKHSSYLRAAAHQ